MKALPKVGLLLFCIFISCGSISGAELVFTDKKMAIQSPGEEWDEVKIPKAAELGVVCAFRKKDKTATFFVMVREISQPFDETWVKNYEDSLIKKGCTKISGDFTTFVGVRAYKFVRTFPLKDTTAMSILFPKDKMIYQIDAMSMSGVVTENKEIEALFKSFRLLE
jgi:hypothetical protein